MIASGRFVRQSSLMAGAAACGMLLGACGEQPGSASQQAVAPASGRYDLDSSPDRAGYQIVARLPDRGAWVSPDPPPQRRTIPHEKNSPSQHANVASAAPGEAASGPARSAPDPDVAPGGRRKVPAPAPEKTSSPQQNDNPAPPPRSPRDPGRPGIQQDEVDELGPEWVPDKTKRRVARELLQSMARQ